MTTGNAKGILVLGATGPSGTLICQRLASSGHSLFPVLRSPARRQEFEALGATIVSADAMDPEGLNSAIAEVAPHISTALNLLGGNPFLDPETWPDRDGVINATNAVQAAGIQRYILVTSVGTGESWQYVPEDAYIRAILELKSAAEQHLKASNLNWTIVKPGGLGPPDFRITRGNPLITLNHGVRGLIDREDLVDVVLRVLAAPEALVKHKEIYAVVDRLEEHDGPAEVFALPQLD